jgi:hypothetical protein
MRHRHIETNEYTLTAIDDVIERGLLRDWLELRNAIRSSVVIADSVKRVCEHQKSCPDFPSRYIFWSNFLDSLKTRRRAIGKIKQNWNAFNSLLEVCFFSTILGMRTELDWDKLLSAASQLRGHIPITALTNFVPNLKIEFDAILAKLESVAGWKFVRVVKPVLILGSLDGVDTGIRQLIRDEPLETKKVSIGRHEIVVPTEEEILRIKGALILKRNATRDYVDFAALSQALGKAVAAQAFQRFDAIYPQENGQSPTQQLCLQLSDPRPFDLQEDKLSSYKNLTAQWQTWKAVKSQCVHAANFIFNSLEPESSDSPGY